MDHGERSEGSESEYEWHHRDSSGQSQSVPGGETKHMTPTHVDAAFWAYGR